MFQKAIFSCLSLKLQSCFIYSRRIEFKIAYEAEFEQPQFIRKAERNSENTGASLHLNTADGVVRACCLCLATPHVHEVTATVTS